MGFWGLISGNTHNRDAFPMATIQNPMQRCNAVLRAFGARYRLREHRRSPWITVYQLGKGGTTREHTVKGYAAADPEAIGRLLCFAWVGSRNDRAGPIAPFVAMGGRMWCSPFLTARRLDRGCWRALFGTQA